MIIRKKGKKERKREQEKIVIIFKKIKNQKMANIVDGVSVCALLLVGGV